MIGDYGDGGENILDIMALNKSLKIAWIVKHIFDDWRGKLVFLGNL